MNIVQSTDRFDLVVADESSADRQVGKVSELLNLLKALRARRLIEQLEVSQVGKRREVRYSAAP